jgi:hypothetical protein
MWPREALERSAAELNRRRRRNRSTGPSPSPITRASRSDADYSASRLPICFGFTK